MMRIECEEECERRDAFQDDNFDEGGARFRVRDGFQGVGTERHSRRVPGVATLHPQGAILERETFQKSIFGAGGCRIGTRHVPFENTRVGERGKDCEG
jgi:hypothetical protein